MGRVQDSRSEFEVRPAKTTNTYFPLQEAILVSVAGKIDPRQTQKLHSPVGYA